MKSPYRLAQEISVTPQAVYKKIKQLNNELNPYIKNEKGKILLDAEAERILRESFSNIQQPIQQPINEPYNNHLNNKSDEFNNETKGEIEFLREQNKKLQDELTKEREHSRDQSNEIVELAKQLARLNENQQILLRTEQAKSNPALVSNNEKGEQETAVNQHQQKKNLFSRIFKKK